MTIARLGSGGPWEEKFGYARVVVAGPHAYVSGSTAVIEGELRHEGDPYRQTIAAFENARKALADVGFQLSDTVRTRLYIVHARDAEEVGRAHRALFSTHPPAATLVVVSGLIDSGMLIEVEVDAYREGL